MRTRSDKKIKPAKSTLTFLCCIAGVYICCQLLEGLHAETVLDAIKAGACLSVIYLLLRPLLRMVSAPVGCVTLGVSGFVIDTALIFLLPKLVPGFTVDGIEWAALTALLVNGMCLITGGFH